MRVFTKCPNCKCNTDGLVLQDEGDPYIVCGWCGAELPINSELIREVIEKIPAQASSEIKEESPKTEIENGDSQTGKPAQCGGSRGSEPLNAKDVAALRAATGCGMEQVKAALRYKAHHPGATAVGYLKAKSHAVVTRNLTFD